MEHNILSVCLSAVVASFIILPSLAIIMHFIVAIFPKEEFKPVEKPVNFNDEAVLSAIKTAYQNLYPGVKIKEITENK